MRIAIVLLLMAASAFGQEITTAASHFTSKPLRDVRVAPPTTFRSQPFLPETIRELPPAEVRRMKAAELLRAMSLRQSSPGPVVPMTRVIDFAGLGSRFRPSDPTGAVGMNQYVQAVNGAGLAVFNKATGNIVRGPTAISHLWEGTNDRCGKFDHGDAIVLYDKIAHRWIVSQFVALSPYAECVAVSTGEDATGTYNLYRFDYKHNPDYPKLAVWPDAYYASYFMPARNPDGTFTDSLVCAFERDKMLAGAAASATRQVCFGLDVARPLPTDFDGGALPAAGTPNIFTRRELNKQQVSLRKFHVDWSDPKKSTFGVGTAHASDAAFNVDPFKDGCSATRNCVPQKGTTQKIDDLGDRLMFRSAYRRFDDHETIVVNHTIEATPVALRWYEIRDPFGTPKLQQQGTFTPDANSRWMASIATDKAGNIAVGYTISGATLHPGINVAARTPDLGSGILGAEQTIFAGIASQGTGDGPRWGDYSQLAVDPADECTFWFTAQRVSVNSPRRRTRIAAFRLNNCTP